LVVHPLLSFGFAYLSCSLLLHHSEKRKRKKKKQSREKNTHKLHTHREYDEERDRQRPCHLDDDATCVTFSFFKITAQYFSRKTDPFFWLELLHPKLRNVKLNRVLKLHFQN
jgi:hypothetical protein